MKTHTFRGRRFRIVTDEVIKGYVELPSKRGLKNSRVLYISADCDGKLDGLYIAVHEALHAEDPDVSEQVTERRSRSLSRFLWRLGYRRE